MADSTEPTAGDEAQQGAVGVLRARRPLRALVAARVLSYGGDSLSLVALMLYVADTAGQALAIALLLLVGDFAPSLLGPLTGTVADRFDLRRVMIACELLQGALVVVVATTLPPLPILLTLVALRAVAAQVFQPASRSVVPTMVPDRELETANSVVGFGANAAEAVGPLLAAALLPWLGIRGVLLVDAASFLVSAIILLALPPAPPTRGAHRDASMLTEARLGLAYIARTPAVRVVALGFCAVVACNGVDDVALLGLARDELRSGDASVGLLLGAVGLGLLAGYALLGRGHRRIATPVLLVLGFLVSSLGNVLTGLAWSVAVAFTLQAARGVGLAGMDVASSTMLQRTVPAGMLGRVFGNFYGLVGVAAALSYIGGGLLLDATNARVTLVAAGAGGLLATTTVALALARARQRPTR